MPHQVSWIQAEQTIHNRHQQVVALAEKSVRIGWTYADAFKNVRKRLSFKKRDYLFATKDYASALEYVRQCKEFAEIFNLSRAILSHGEETMPVPRLDQHGRPSSFTEDIKLGHIKFDNGSRIIAFSASPQAMAVYGGDVGLDEFARHPNARLLWETAQGRITWGYDLAIWSAHDGEDTLFNEFALEARARCLGSTTSAGSPPSAPILAATPKPTLGLARTKPPPKTGSALIKPRAEEHHALDRLLADQDVPAAAPWNLYYRVTMPGALQLGLLDVINRTRGTRFTAEQFLADCRSRAREQEVYEQSYLCNPLGASTSHIVDWSAIERCRFDYKILRLHLEHSQIIERFGEITAHRQSERERNISNFILLTFNEIFKAQGTYRLGFDVAASGQGDLAAIYLDEEVGPDLWLRALLTFRTEDWSFIKTTLFCFLAELSCVQAAGDQTGLGHQICWEASQRFGSRFTAVNFSSKKHELGFCLMNQLATASKRFPGSEQDIASDYFALRKAFSGSRWVFSEGRNDLNPASHCDIAWAGALASHAHQESTGGLCASVLVEGGVFKHFGWSPP
jgi:phage FluMu gp28-like protein